MHQNNLTQSHSHHLANNPIHHQYSLQQQYNTAYCNGIMSAASSSSSSNDNESSSLGYSNPQVQYPSAAMAAAAASSAAWYSSQSDPRFASKLKFEIQNLGQIFDTKP
jgi:hypothetical protein